MRSVDRLELERGGIAGEKDRSFHRQVTLLDEASWSAATAEVGIDPGWMYRRANVFVKGVDLQACIGTRIRLGDAVLEIGGELRPCSLMDEGISGLHDALRPECRGGVYARIIEEGEVRLGDSIEPLSIRV